MLKFTAIPIGALLAWMTANSFALAQNATNSSSQGYGWQSQTAGNATSTGDTNFSGSTNYKQLLNNIVQSGVGGSAQPGAQTQNSTDSSGVMQQVFGSGFPASPNSGVAGFGGSTNAFGGANSASGVNTGTGYPSASGSTSGFGGDPAGSAVGSGSFGSGTSGFAADPAGVSGASALGGGNGGGGMGAAGDGSTGLSVPPMGADANSTFGIGSVGGMLPEAPGSEAGGGDPGSPFGGAFGGAFGNGASSSFFKPGSEAGGMTDSAGGPGEPDAGEDGSSNNPDGQAAPGNNGTTSDTSGSLHNATTSGVSAKIDTPMRRALSDLNAHDFAGCISKLDDILAKDPHNAKAHYLKGVVYVMTRHYSQAATEYKEAVKYATTNEMRQKAQAGLSKLNQ